MPTVADTQITQLSGLNHIDALLDIGPDWNYLTPVGDTILYTFSVASGNESGQAGQQAFSAAQQTAARMAMSYLSAITGINFVETGAGAAAQVHLCSVDLQGANVTGLCSWTETPYATPDGQLTALSASAYVYLDNREWGAINANLTPGGQGYETLLHELGHMLGLKHPFDSSITLPAAQDSTVNTLMSYKDVGGPYSSYRQYDIAALNWLYGGDGLRGNLGLNSTAGARYITGTNLGDALIGTPFNDTLEGDGGNDMINGGDGTDTAIFHGNFSAYTLTEAGGGALTVAGPDGADTLTSVEVLKFADLSVQRAQVADTTPPAAPTVSVTKNANGYVAGDSALVVGIAEANTKIEVRTSSGIVGTAVADGNGFWSLLTAPFTDGLNYTIFAKATDAAGNVSAPSANISFNVDSHAPVAPTASFTLAAGSNVPSFSGTGEAGTIIKLVSNSSVVAQTTVASNGTWSVTANPLPNAGYDVVVSSIDKADNATAAPSHLSFTVASNTNIVGTSGNDTINQTPGNNNIDGGAGIDTVVYAGARSNYEITKGSGGYVVTAKSGVDGTDVLTHIEAIKFSDVNLSVAYDDVVQALYVAYFGRAADYTGLANFQAQLAGLNAPLDFSSVSAAYNTNAGIHSLIDSFGTSAESAALYPSGTNAFVTAVYHNIFNRDPDAGGLAFWTNAIDHNGLSQANASLSIMAGALANTTAQGKLDAQLVNNKTTIASDFSFAIDTSAEINGYNGNAAAATVRNMLSSVTASTDINAFQATIKATLAGMSGGAQATAMASDTHVDAQLVGVPHASEVPLLA